MKKIALTLLTIFSIFAISCEIGLGASVDTDPPSLNIANPPVDSIIRDDFAISGTWADDGYIDSISIKLERTDGNGSAFNYNAEFVVSEGKINEGTWKAVIKPVTEKVLDGPYQATVTIKDTVGRETIRNITFSIDNTPPVVVLQRPSSILSSSESDTDTYGQVLTLVGQAADDNNINTIDVQLYSDAACTNLLNTVTLNNVPATINLDVATFEASKENDYSKIYGHTDKSGAETRYSKIVAYDSAQRYPVDGSNQTASDTRGNKQSIYYLYEDISSDILSKHKITELYSMFNGTYIYAKGNRSISQSDANSILTKLASKKIASGKFIINPDNSPTFQLSGREALKGDGNDFYTSSNGKTDNNISNNSTAIIEVSPGLDGIPLDGDSLRVYVQECDEYGNVITENGKDAKIYLPYYQDNESNGKTKNGSGYKFVLEARSGYPSEELDGSGQPKNKLTLGNYYIFGVEGHDKNEPNGNPIVAASGKGYGFYFAASGAAPTLTAKLEQSSDGNNWTEVTSQVSYLPKNTYVKISGNIKVEAGAPNFHLKHNYDDYSIDAGITFDSTEYSFEKTYSPSDFGSSSKQHGFILEAAGSGGKTEKSYTVMYDMEGPEITDPEIKILGRNPLATKYTDEAGTTDEYAEKYINGDNIRIKLSISDDFDVVDSTTNKPKIEIFEGSWNSDNPPSASAKISKEITNPANFSWSDIATKNKIADGLITIRVTAYDRAGNKTEKYYSDYYVDQSTDNPVVLPNNAAQLSFTIKTKAELTESKNKFASGSPILLQLIDDDELNTITPSIASIAADATSPSGWETVTPPVDISGKTNYTYSYTNSRLSSTGFYALKFIVTDKYNNETKVPADADYFVIKITAAAPTIEDLSSVVKDKDGADQESVYTRGIDDETENYFENKIIFDSEYDNFEIRRSVVENENYIKIADQSSANLRGTNGSYIYLDKVRPSSTTKYYYQIVGIEGTQQVNSNVKNVTCKVDSTKPSSVVLKTLPTVSNTEDDTFTISGTAADEGGSGIEKVKITIKGTHDSASVEKTVDATGQNSWSYDLTYASFGDVFKTEGVKSIYVQAIDVAGNASDFFKYGATTDYNNTSKLLTFEYDKKAPLFTVTGLSESEVNALDKEVNETGYTISGTITEGYALAETGAITITVDGISLGTLTAPVQSTTDSSSYTWSYEIPKGTEDGKLKDDELVEVKVTVKDKVGKQSSKSFTLYYDTKVPDLEIKSPAEGEKIDNNAKVIKGTVSDGGFGVKQIEYELREHGTETIIKDSSGASGKDISGAFRYNDEGVATRYGNYPLTIKGEQWYSVNSSGAEASIPLGETEGDLDLYIKVTEKSKGLSGGRTTEVTRNFYFDKYNPNLTETEIGTAGLTTSDAEITLKGVAYDTNAIKSVKIKYNNGSADVVKEATLDNMDAEVSGVSYTENQYAEWSFTFETDNKEDVDKTTANQKYLPDGNYVFTIEAEDVSGKTVQLSRAVNLDTKAPSAPTVTVTTEKGATLGTADWYTTSSLDIVVTADDGTNGTGVSTVEYNTDRTEIVNPETNETTVTYDATKWMALAPQKDGTVTKFKGTVSLRDDENVIFGVRATDVAGNISEISEKTVNVDTSAPTLTAVSYKYNGDDVVAKTDSVYVNGSKKLIVYGSYEDDDTGLQALEIKLGTAAVSGTGVTVKYSASAMNGINPPAETTFKEFSDFSGSTNTTKTIKTWMLEFTPNADGDLKLNGKNRINKAAQECKAFTIVKDDEDPQLTNVTLVGAYKPDENVETFFLNNTNTNFKLTGVSTDNIGPESLTITLTNSADTSLTLTPVLNAAEGSLNKWNFTLDATDKALWDGSTKWPADYATESLRGKSKWQGGATVKVTLTDKAKNTATWDGTIYFDTEAPAGYHQIDDKNKDIFFRIGDAENDDINSTDNPTLWNNAKDKDVGSKYSTVTFGDAETVMFRGTLIDYPAEEFDSETKTPNSGVKMVYYKVINEKDLTTSKDVDLSTSAGAAARSAEVYGLAAAFAEEYEDPAKRDGYFAPNSAGTRRVFYNVENQTNPNTRGGIKLADSLEDGYYKYYKEVESTFKTTISGFEQGVNYLAFVIVDNVGNAALEAVKVPDFDANGNPTGTYTEYNNYQINVDQTVPVITTDSTTTKYVNGTADLPLSGTVTDALSGVRVKGFEIKIGDTTETISVPKENITPADDSTDPNKKIWTFSIPKEKFTTSGEITIYAIARDNAGTNGNPTTINAATVFVDKTYPSTTINNPQDADDTTDDIEVNGTFTLTGTSSDNSRIVESVEIQYSTDISATTPVWTPYRTVTTDTASWSIDVETIDSSKNAVFADGTYYFRAIATDKAGNTGNSGIDANAIAANNYVTIKVSQDSDRPIIRLSNLSFRDGTNFMSAEEGKETWLNTSQLFASITDDDGALTSVQAIAVGKNGSAPVAADWAPKTASDGTIIPAPANLHKNGTFTFTFEDNGYKKLYFRVVDHNGTEFISSTTSTSTGLFGAKIIGTADTTSTPDRIGYAGNVDDIIYVRIDTTPPVMEELTYYSSASVITDTSTIAAESWKVSSKLTTDVFGGTLKRYVYIKYKAYDDNGIASVEPSLTYVDPNDINATKTAAYKANTQLASDATTKTYVTYFDLGEKETTGENKVGSGAATFKFNIKDQATARKADGQGEIKSYLTTIDNSAPEVEITYPTNKSLQYGTSAVNLRTRNTDKMEIAKVEYAITKESSLPAAGLAESEWTTITDNTKTSYTATQVSQILFDGLTTKVDSANYHAGLLKNTLFTKYGITDESEQAAYDETQPLYFWIRSTDELGNTGITTTEFYMNIIPNGDRPSVTVTYPETTSKEDNHLGGDITITGIADIQDTSANVTAVYLQIDPDYDGSSFDTDALSTYLEGIAEDSRPEYSPVAVTTYIIGKNEDNSINRGNLTSGNAFNGILVTENTNSIRSWRFTINKKSEFDSKVEINDEEENRVIGIRAVAVSSTGKVSYTDIYSCEIDADAPTFGNNVSLAFVQRDSNGHELARRKYESGVFLSGVNGAWYLEGSLEDSSGINSLTVTRKIDEKSTPVSYDIVSNGQVKKAGEITNTVSLNNEGTTSWKNNGQGYEIRIPIGSSDANAFGKYIYTIRAEDKSTPPVPNPLNFTINYDNKAPEFEAKTGNGKNLTAADGKIIRQSNGTYHVAGTFKEASTDSADQSGFSRIAMFFTRERTNAGVTKVYLLDPMIADGDNGRDNWENYQIGTKSGSTITPLANIEQKQGLFWRKVTATKLENGNELTLSAAVANVRKNGLCMINNVIYHIDDIEANGTKIRLKGTLDDINAPTVYFALAQVIDHQSQESGKTVIYTGTEPSSISGGDGDCMVEGVSYQSGVYNWWAELDSSNMMDGKVKMQFVAFDAAGNHTEVNSFDMEISNNAPRFAAVTFGSDRNLDNTVTLDEMDTDYQRTYKEIPNSQENNTIYNGQNTSGEWITSWNPYAGKDSSGNEVILKRLAVKGAIKVIPEIVGGNSGLAWTYSYTKIKSATETEEAELETPIEFTKTVQVNGVETVVNVGHSNDGSVRPGLTIERSLLQILQDGVADGEQLLTFKIWDNTDDAAFADEDAGSKHADLIIPVDVVIRDTTKPKAFVNPFKWLSSSNNSLYQNSKSNGHIELESDLPGAFTADGSGVYDLDAKVSGMITFDGTATDNVAVNKISVKIPGYNDGEEFTIAERDSSAGTTGGWKSVSGTAQNIVNHLYYSSVDANGNKTPVAGYQASLLGTGAPDWVCELTSDCDTYDATTGQNKVTYKFHFNTAAITNVADTNVGIEFYAYDKGSPEVKTVNGSPAVAYSGANVSDIKIKKNPTDNDTTAKLVSTGRTYDNDKELAAVDPDNPDANKTPYYKVDIVPYITGITTPNRSHSGLKDNNIRSASGKYSIIKGSTSDFIEVTGFNLNPGANDVRIVDSETVADTEVTASTGEKVTRSSAASAAYTLFKLSNALSKSGYLEVFTNGVRVLNNINSNDSYGSYSLTGKEKEKDDQGNETDTEIIFATETDYENAYNREPDYYSTKNVQLTDDRYIRVFDMKDTGVKNGYYPVMVMSKETNRKDNPVFGYVSLTGAPANENGEAGDWYSSYAMPQRAEFVPSTTASTASARYTEYLIKGSIWDQMGMAVDNGGRYYHVSVYNREQCNMAFIYDRFCELHYSNYIGYGAGWGAGVVMGSTDYYTMSNASGNNAINLETVNYNELAVGRYQYPKIVVNGNSRSGDASVYMMYYDDGVYYQDDTTKKTGGLIFRDFKIGTNITGTTLYSSTTNKDNESRSYSQKYNFTENPSNKNDDTYSGTYRHTVAENASNNFSMGVTSGGVVVFVYYDVSLSRLVLKYSSTDTDSKTAQAIDGSTPGTAPKWTTSSVTFPLNVGTYVSLALDGNAVHISAFDSYDSNLVYMYMPSYSGNTMQAVTVDQASAVGNWTQIKVNNHIPYIAYYNSTENGGRDGIKLAMSNTAINGNVTVTSGTDNEPGTSKNAAGTGSATGYTTGAWEYMTIPAINPPQGGDPKFQNVCLDFDSAGIPVVGYLATNLEFGKWIGE